MNMGLEKKNVFMTGASRGIGKKIKEAFLDCGAQVAAPGRNELDLSDRENIVRYLDENPEIHPDIFVHCAGINELAGIEEIGFDTLDQVFQVNHHAPAALIRQFSRHMKDNGWGRIVFISSVYALVSRERRIAYASSKNALTGLTKTLTLELAKYNILTNSVAPGYILTDMTKKNLSREEIQRIQDMIPAGRLQTEEDIANLTVFLCSDLNQSITGQVIAADGGFTCR